MHCRVHTSSLVNVPPFSFALLLCPFHSFFLIRLFHTNNFIRLLNVFLSFSVSLPLNRHTVCFIIKEPFKGNKTKKHEKKQTHNRYENCQEYKISDKNETKDLGEIKKKVFAEQLRFRFFRLHSIHSFFWLVIVAVVVVFVMGRAFPNVSHLFDNNRRWMCTILSFTEHSELCLQCAIKQNWQNIFGTP